MRILLLLLLFLFFVFLTDPPEKTIDQTSIDEFRSLLDLNLVNYFIFCKVSTSNKICSIKNVLLIKKLNTTRMPMSVLTQ